jgi:uncharacterized DUF497 family protein
MADLHFEWDTRKSVINEKKHGVSFVEAQSVFYDDDALLIVDQLHSAQEERFLLLGLSSRLREIVVAHCYRESGGTIRIISARKATRTERQQYLLRKR